MSFYIEDNVLQKEQQDEKEIVVSDSSDLQKKLDRLERFTNGTYVNTQSENIVTASKYSFVGFVVGVGYALVRGKSILANGIIFGVGAGCLALVFKRKEVKE